MRTAREVREITGRWVEEQARRTEGLRAAHFVGSITSAADDAEFPAHKDVDVHLIYDEGSAELAAGGPFHNIREVEYDGVLIEAGVKSVAEYASAATVLANPEVAHHLTLACVAYDPAAFLAPLQDAVKRDYAEPRWLEARIEHERQGLAGAMQMLQVASAMYGASGELNLLGYSFTYIGAMLDCALLRAPSTGSRFSLRMRSTLEDERRSDLYERFLAVLGVEGLMRWRAEGLLAQGAEAFDLAVQVKRSPHPFGHKLNAHLRPYFVESCRTLIDEDYHREAAMWASPFLTSSVDVILSDGPETERPRFAAMQSEWLADAGLTTPEARAERIAEAQRLHADFIALAERLAGSRQPAVVS